MFDNFEELLNKSTLTLIVEKLIIQLINVTLSLILLRRSNSAFIQPRIGAIYWEIIESCQTIRL